MSGTENVFFIGELVKSHQGEWLALEVIERDENGLPKRARLIASASNRLELRDKVRDSKDVYIKFAGPVAPAQYGFLY